MLRASPMVILGTLGLAFAAPGAAQAADTNILAPRFDLGIWTIVVFGVLLLVLRKVAWTPMLEGLKKREDTIHGSIEEAKKSREEMECLRAQFKAELDEANAQIPRLMDEARQSAQRMIEEMRAKATEEIQSERQRTRNELEVARDQLLQQLTEHTAQLATLVSAKAIGRSLSEEDHRRLVQEAVQEIAQSNGAAV